MQSEHNFTKTYTIVIDPGHAGENLGADYQRTERERFVEKDLTLVTALAMKEELEKYDNVEVVLTRETDLEKDISLKNRVKVAKDKEADFLISLHYNMSVSHILYGAEVWVPSKGSLYNKGASLGTEFMKEFDEMSLFHRGIKTRLNDKGTDYYGILRNAVEMKVPAVLIEHCHLDNERDFDYYDSNEKLQEFGKRDATAVAKYLGLSSSNYGMDYRDYERTEFSIPEDTIMKPDLTEPETCHIRLESYDTETGEITIIIEASDSESAILYYTYSYDNGETYAPLMEWGDEGSVTVIFKVEKGTTPRILAKAYNGYDIFAESNLLELPIYEVEKETETSAEDTLLIEAIALDKMQQEQEVATGQRVHDQVLGLGILCCVLSLFLFTLILLRIRNQKRKRRKKKQLKKKNSVVNHRKSPKDTFMK